MYSHAEIPPRVLLAGVPVLRAALAQALACATLLAIDGGPTFGIVGQAVMAAALGLLLRLPPWWIPVNLAFVPAVAVASTWAVSPTAYLAGFLALAGVYGIASRTRAPLYLTGIGACQALSTLLPANRSFRFLDAGCGIGTTVTWLSARHLAGTFEGVELAPLPAGLAWIRARLSGGLFTVQRADLWSLCFTEYDVVYAFLSPVPMAALLEKARREMRSGSLLVSNTFLPGGLPPDLSIPLDGRGRMLHAWRF